MPKFNGNGGESFETWQISARDFLNRFALETKAFKVKALLCRVEGYAWQAIEAKRPEIQSVKDVFACLQVTYGKMNAIYFTTVTKSSTKQ